MDLKKIIGGVALLSYLTLTTSVRADSPYETILKKLTRSDKVYVVDNFEVRMIWNATYLSDDFRAARRERLAKLLGWSNAELLQKVREDGEESRTYDVFFLSIYAGSAKFPDIGKNDA